MATLSLMAAPSGGGGAGESRPAGLGRSAGRADPLGGVGTKSRLDGASGQGRLGAGPVGALPVRAGVGARGDDARDSTAHRTGLCGTPGATRVVESGGCTRALAGSWSSSTGPGHPDSGSGCGHHQSRASGYWSARCGGHTAPGTARRARGLARWVCRRRPTPGSKPTRE
jgi:hypothetical protein